MKTVNLGKLDFIPKTPSQLYKIYFKAENAILVVEVIDKSMCKALESFYNFINNVERTNKFYDIRGKYHKPKLVKIEFVKDIYKECKTS